jgi:hypothetical protein
VSKYPMEMLGADLSEEYRAKEIFLQALRENDGRYTDALTAAQVSDGQVKRWSKNDPVFFADYELAQTYRNDKELRMIHERMDRDDERGDKFLLKAMVAKPQYAKRSSVEVKGSVDHHHALDQMSQDEMRHLIDVGKKALGPATDLEEQPDGSYE